MPHAPLLYLSSAFPSTETIILLLRKWTSSIKRAEAIFGFFRN